MSIVISGKESGAVCKATFGQETKSGLHWGLGSHGRDSGAHGKKTSHRKRHRNREWKIWCNKL